MTGWIVVVLIVAFALAAPRYGVDTRSGDGRARQRPRARFTVRGDLVALARRVRGSVGYGPAS